MTKGLIYKDELRVLYETYTGRELEEALGVTTRSMQNYLKTDGATTPGRDVINKIHEVFANHMKGEPLVSSPQKEVNGDFKDKYIALLEKLNLDRGREIEETRQKLTVIETALAEAKKNQLVMYSIQMAFQETVLPLLGGQRRKAIEREAGEKALAYLEKSLREGIVIG